MFENLRSRLIEMVRGRRKKKKESEPNTVATRSELIEKFKLPRQLEKEKITGIRIVNKKKDEKA